MFMPIGAEAWDSGGLSDEVVPLAITEIMYLKDKLRQVVTGHRLGHYLQDIAYS